MSNSWSGFACPPRPVRCSRYRRLVGPIMDCNVHLWDQRDDPVFWLADRTLVRDMLGDYDSLPDVYRLGDYLAETDRHVRGNYTVIALSDADADAAADPNFIKTAASRGTSVLFDFGARQAVALKLASDISPQ